MKIAVIGTGYVGLVAGVCWAYVGNKVTCVDIDESKVRLLRAGKSPIFEPGLEERLEQSIQEKNISFTNELGPAARAADISVIAVGTPSDPDGAYNSKYVLGAAKEISEALAQSGERKFVVIRSTINTDMYGEVREVFAQQPNVEVISNPEFLAQGTAVRDFEKPDRVIIGTTAQDARKIMAQLYADFLKPHGELFFVKPESAILTKLGANNHLYTRIMVNNELAELCDQTGADFEEVRVGMGADRRIGKEFLYAGPGVGGSCFGKDNRDITAVARRKGLELLTLPSVDAANKQHKQYVVEKVMAPFYERDGGIEGKQIGVWGLAFKALTDDMRESASIDIINGLLARGVQVRAHDPQAMERAKQEFGDRVAYCRDKYEAVNDAHGLLILTEWPIYKNPDFPELQHRLQTPVIFDTRSMLKRDQVVEHGLTHYALGRGFAYPK